MWPADGESFSTEAHLFCIGHFLLQTETNQAFLSRYGFTTSAWSRGSSFSLQWILWKLWVITDKPQQPHFLIRRGGSFSAKPRSNFSLRCCCWSTRRSTISGFTTLCIEQDPTDASRKLSPLAMKVLTMARAPGSPRNSLSKIRLG